ncbi:MAG: hypothetical protein Fur0010_13730 [Bdellovibrio sp.]
MKLVFRNFLTPFALFSTLLSSVLIVAMAYYFWQKGLLNPELASNVYESNQMVDELKKLNLPEKISNFVVSDSAREAYSEIENFEKKLNELNKNFDIAESITLSEQLNEIKSGLKGLIAVPEFKNILSVLNNKMGDFSNFVTENRWPTLIRISQRQMSRTNVSSLSKMTPSRLSGLVSAIKNDFTLMATVTNSSVLPEKDKNLIISKLANFSKEIEMMERYVASMQSISNKMKELNLKYENWMKSIQPQMSMKKIQIEKYSEYFLYSIVGISSLMLALTFLMFWISKIDQRRMQKKMEEYSLMIIKEGLIPFQVKMPYQMSEYFHAELNKQREYIHKRMSFGAIFQDALPFSALLLDSNLNMVWANQLFFDNWSIDANQREKTWSWDFLQQSTNLGEVDPVMMALKEGIAGIYQIQVQHAEDESLPYEMYVSPVEYAEQKRIMIFFYPLRSVEETLANQTRAIVGPVSRSLDHMIKGTYDKDFQEKVMKDFSIAGIEDIHEKFSQVLSINNQQRNSLLAEIERLENHLYDEHKLVDDLNEKIEHLKSENKEVITSFESIKNQLMGYVQTRFELYDLEQNAKRFFNEFERSTQSLYSVAQHSNEILSENVKALSNIKTMREDFHKLREEIENYRFQVVQTLEQTLVFCRREGLDASLEGAFGKIKMEIKGFERILNQLSNSIKGLDVAFSKIELIGQSASIVNLNDIKDSQSRIAQDYENNHYHIGRLVRQAEKSEETIVRTLKDMFDHFQALRRHVQWSEELITQKRSFSEGQSDTHDFIDEHNHKRDLSTEV